MTAILGLNAKLYRNTGTWAAPVWSELTLAKEVTTNLEAAEADASVRAGAGWRETLAALKDATLEYELRHDQGDAGNDAIRTAFFANPSTIVELLRQPLLPDVRGLEGVAVRIDKAVLSHGCLPFPPGKARSKGVFDDPSKTI